MTAAPRYAPFWCEENVWHLCNEAESRGLRTPHAVFISSPSRSVGMWAQRAAPPGEPVVWDYHVVLFFRNGGDRHQWNVYDLDCRRGPTLSLQDWLDASFPFTGVIPPELEPTFRIVPCDAFLETFRTDRSHMENPDGSYKAPPPSWDHLHQTSNIWDFVDPAGDAPGAVFDLQNLRDHFVG